jgi:hypothetical protein
MENKTKNPFIKRGAGGNEAKASNPEFITNMNKEQKNEMLDGVKDRYELVGIVPGRVIWRDHDIDFRKISLQTAAHLVEAGCPYIREKQTATDTKAKNSSETK